MLQQLSISQFVIIDHLDLDWRAGLTILTGETGAGKSILLDAMGLILGEESDPDSIRHGASEATIQALFAPRPAHPVWNVLKEHNITDDQAREFQIRRVIRQGSGDDIRINDKPVALDTLKEIGTFLVEIHGQFANQSLMEPDNQLSLLDASGDFPPDVFSNVSNALKDVRQYEKELEEEKIFLARHKAKARDIEGIVSVFDKMGMKDGFIDYVQKEHAELRRAKETSEILQSILGRLIAASGIVVALSGANQTLARQQYMDTEKIAKLSHHLSASLDHAREAVKEIGVLSPEYEIDTGPLQQYTEILNTLNKISTDRKIPFEELEDYYNDMSAKLARLRKGREKLGELEQKLADAKHAYREHARVLTEKRTVAGKALSEAVTAELPPLKLEKAEFQVNVEENQNMPWTERGLNQVTFMARMNPGQPLSPIAETASGGEMARLMLALKVVVQQVQTTETLVFDEVDTGIGGAAAAAVGERLAQLADQTQVLVITHSPQVAARGEQHLHVSKKTDGVTTTSHVRTLNDAERIDEISRMLSGDQITPESTAAAQRLIREATEAAGRRRTS